MIGELEHHLLVAIHRELDGIGVTSLGHVLRRGQEYASLYLSTESQIADLASAVPSRNIKGEMSDWHFISFQLDRPEMKRLKVILVGDRGHNAITTTTSPVKGIDLVEGLVRTENSVYRLRLDERGTGEPSPKQLVCLCRTLHSWRLGHAFNVPRV